jgi:galacturan 1,4-alpha-galacturonidase
MILPLPLAVWVFVKLSTALHLGIQQDLPKQSCTIQPNRDGSDDSPAILAAFDKCGQGGRIVFLAETYHIGKVMKTVGLKDCQIDIQGILKVSVERTRKYLAKEL